MPAKAITRRAPKTTRRKVWVHAFYLCQPFLQFFALIAVLIVFTRCSPLASSTDKASALKTSPRGGDTSGLAEALALEDSFLKNLKELSVTEMEVVSETGIEAVAKDAPHIDLPMEENEVRSFFELRNRPGITGPLHRRPNVLFLPLNQELQDSFFANSIVRIDLSSRLKGHTKDNARRLLFQNLRQSVDSKELGAAIYLTLPDSTMARVQGAFSDLKIQVKISLSLPDEDKAYLEVRRLDEGASQAGINAALLAAALKEDGQLAILLE